MKQEIFTLTGQVEPGKRVGRTYGMPTANISPSEDVTGLEYGVYYSTIKIDGSEYPAITDLGVRPTVTSDGKVRAETFIYGYDDDLYGKEVEVKLLEFRRSEKKFSSLDELYETVKEDFRAGARFHEKREP